MKMIARYERGKALNVRKAPAQNAPVVRTMKRGDEAECLEIRDGWAKLADGFANAAFLVVRLGDAADVIQEAAQADEPAPIDDDEAAELRRMTNPQLYDLAEQSGVKVKKGASKAELIAAILADE